MKNSRALAGACKNFEEDLVLDYYGEHDGAERTRIEEHLAQCPGCRRFVDDLQRLLPNMRRRDALSQGFWDDYYRETVAKLALQDERKSCWQDFLTPLRMWMIPAFGTVAVAILALGLVIGKGKITSFVDGSSANPPQEILADGNQLEFFESLDMVESLSHLEKQDGGKLEPTSSLPRRDSAAA